MPVTTEAYYCQRGQSLEEAIVELRPEIGTREQARQDADDKCHADKRIERIVYYSLDALGERTLLLSYENPYLRIMVNGPPPDAEHIAQKTGRHALLDNRAKNARGQSGPRGPIDLLRQLADRLLYE